MLRRQSAGLRRAGCGMQAGSHQTPRRLVRTGLSYSRLIITVAEAGHTPWNWLDAKSRGGMAPRSTLLNPRCSKYL
ncbi:hypothetical protein CNECB9_5460034 [Cupriavidus necator]|uniref:Uncharacterized protein n=1 Tax=Cupriavidus necator TaxID=106590 RepID=A0A1K0IR65_CUPNE|nr:hypothetical protein CNECB9_5460034 [Cupriavidus necator]